MCQAYAPRDPLAELARGDLTLNRFRILVQHLPPDSALHRALPDLQGWTPTEYLLAESINAARYHIALTAAVNSEDGGFQEPEWVETPQTARQRAQEEEERREQLAQTREWFSQIEHQLG